MVLAREPARMVWNCGLALNCGTTRVPMRGNMSTSPESMAAAWAAVSEMKRKVALLIFALPGLRKPSHLLSVIEEPLTQLSSL
ncbi:MAG: hypothetical protein GAK39_03379 [Variovorax sp.]|nr:MAG: hypothetical protein GAK39_03379 [Variovorax sp.]